MKTGRSLISTPWSWFGLVSATGARQPAMLRARGVTAPCPTVRSRAFEGFERFLVVGAKLAKRDLDLGFSTLERCFEVRGLACRDDARGDYGDFGLEGFVCGIDFFFARRGEVRCC